MADILLITDQQRISTIITRASEKVGGRLRVVPTLAQGEEEIAAHPPRVAFVQAGISGLGAREVLHHLYRLLPSWSELVLLNGGSDGADSHGADAVDLSLNDAALEGAIAARLASAGAEGAKQAGTAPEPSAPPAETAKELLFASRHDDPDLSGSRGNRLAWVSGIIAAALAASMAYYVASRPPTPAPIERKPAQRPSVSAPAPPATASPAAATAR